MTVVAFPLTPKYMTSNMTLNGHFTLNFHNNEQPFQNLLFTYLPLSLFISRDQRRCAEADRDPQNIWDTRKHCGIADLS